MKIIRYSDTEPVKTPHGVDVRKLYEYENAQVMHISLRPGESLKPHITPVDVFFYILQGVVNVRVGNETQSVAADNLVESPKDIVHNLSNTSDQLARILVVKSPKPTAQARLL